MNHLSNPTLTMFLKQMKTSDPQSVCAYLMRRFYDFVFTRLPGCTFSGMLHVLCLMFYV